MKTSYPDSFKKLLDNFKESAPYNYIGQGNPGANILIVGKECTTPEKIDEQKYPGEKDFYTIETKMNFETWKNNVHRNIDFDDVPDWETSPMHFHEKYNPLFPYNSHRVGWSKTWDAYQKLINHLLMFNDVIEDVLKDLALNLLCDYVYGIATKFSEFYENCKIQGNDSRILITELCKRFMKLSFDLLGLTPIEKI